MRARVAGACLILAAAAAAALPARATTTPPPLRPFFAGMHNHTGYSDGVPGTTPATAYAKARANGLDVMTVTEHSEGFDVPMTLSEQCLDPEIARCALADGTNSVRKWDATLEQAGAATHDGFLGVRGFEWTSDVEDHIDVYLSSAYTNAKIDGGYATMNTFWRWFLANEDGLATFNHPGDKTNVNTGGAEIAPGPYDDFRYVPAADRRVVGIEVFNGGKSKDYTQRNGVNWIARALNHGWHVGMVGAQDTHTDDWGDGAKWARTAFLMQSNDPASFRDAMLARRFYATTDANLDVRFTATDADASEAGVMGARIRRPYGAAMTLTVDATDPDGEAIASIELLTAGPNDTFAVAGSSANAPTLSAPVTSSWGEGWYLARVTQADGEKAYTSPIWIGANAHPYGEWLAGDLHVHTQNGHDTCVDPQTKFDGTPCDEPWTWSFSPGERIELAKQRGLDYLAITDHSNVVSQSDPAFKAEQTLTLIPAYENSLPGHAQMLGATHCFGGQRDERPANVTITYCTNPDTSDAGVRAEIDAIHAEGGVFQINHPGDRDWSSRYGHRIVPDSVEVWNIGTWAWQPPAPASTENDYSLAFWEGFLNAGHRVTATGGSDSHWRLTSERQGVGQPTTWVYATPGGYQDVLEGIRAGATTISWDYPALHAPRVYLEGDADGNGTFESMPGDVMPMQSRIRVRVENAPPGAMVRIVEHGDAYSGDNVSALYPIDQITGGAFSSPFRWLRAELVLPGSDPSAQANRTEVCDTIGVPADVGHCRNRLTVLAMTSAIYQEAA